MHPRLATGFVAGLILTLTAAVQGQGPPGGMPPPGMGGPGGPGGQILVMFPSVQEDVGLSKKQKDQLKKIEATAAQRRREARENQGEGGPDPQEMMAVMTQLRREQDSAVAKVLDKKQKDRVAQIELQREGLLSVAKKDVATKLKLTATQNKKVRTIMDEMLRAQAAARPRPPGGGFPGGGGPPPGGAGGRAGRRPNPDDPAAENGAARQQGPGDQAPGAEGQPGDGPRPGGGFGRDGGPRRGGPPNFDTPEARAQFAKMREVMEKTRKEATEKVGEVLTDTQKANFDKMLGKPFDLSTIRPGPPPDGPGREPGKGKRAPRKDATT